MAEIVNLRMARKRAARAEKERVADAKRIAHGMPAQERKLARTRAMVEGQRLDGHRREKPEKPE